MTGRTRCSTLTEWFFCKNPSSHREARYFILVIAMPTAFCRNFRALILGVESSPDPYSGVGIACSLRSAFPSCELVAVDRSPQSSGLNWPDFDEYIVLPTRRHLARRCADLAPCEYLLPCDDEEIYWLAANLRNSKRLLMPNLRCLRQIRKPANEVARQLAAEA